MKNSVFVIVLMGAIFLPSCHKQDGIEMGWKAAFDASVILTGGVDRWETNIATFNITSGKTTTVKIPTKYVRAVLVAVVHCGQHQGDHTVTLYRPIFNGETVVLYHDPDGKLNGRQFPAY